MFRGMVPSKEVRLGIGRLRDESIAQEYKRKLAESFDKVSAGRDYDDSEEPWTGDLNAGDVGELSTNTHRTAKSRTSPRA